MKCKLFLPVEHLQSKCFALSVYTHIRVSTFAYTFLPDDGLVEVKTCWRYNDVSNKIYKNLSVNLDCNK